MRRQAARKRVTGGERASLLAVNEIRNQSQVPDQTHETDHPLGAPGLGPPSLLGLGLGFGSLRDVGVMLVEQGTY